MAYLIVTFVIFGLVILMMSIGVIFSGRCIRGSCGGEEIVGPDGELLNCDACPARKESEESLAKESQGTQLSVSK